MMALNEDTLYLGLTRPATKFGVTLEALVFCIFVSGMVFFLKQNPLYFAVVVPLHGICFLVEKNEPRAFRLLLIWLRTAGACSLVTKRYWGASTRDPFPRRRY